VLSTVLGILVLFRYNIKRAGDDCHCKDNLLLIIPEKRGIPCHTEPHGEATELVRRQKEQGKTWIKLLLWVLWEGMDVVSNRTVLGLNSVNNVGRLLA
jgi:hypothetical protein